jgi:two-component system, OmpR family, phosphate regulon sensor histidine kinase PhoR
MNRNKFIGLIILMVIALSGIIWIQWIWIRSAINIRNENFDRLVMSCLNDASNTIEANRRMRFFDNPIFNDPNVFNTPQGEVSGYLSVGTYSSKDGKNVNISVTNQSVTGTIDSFGKVKYNQSVVTRKDTSINADSGTILISAPINRGELKSKGETPEINPDNGTVRVNKQEFLDWIKKRSNEFQNMNNQMIAELYQWEKTMELDRKEVGFTLRRSFLYSGIETPFEFAVITDGKVGDSDFKKTEKNDFLKSHYKVQLFPDNIIRQNILLSVVFPERTTYVLGSMSFILGGSLLFSFIILATFALSLYFIIHQKKIADMKSDFLNNMTHEFKTPIATISLAADTITNPKVIKDEASIRHFISMIKKENSRMNKKVETILQIASLDKKEIAFRFDNVSMHTIIEHVVDTIEIQVHQKKGRINLNLNAGEPVIFGDHEHLTNLVNNLLDNAIKYSPESPDITVTTANRDGGLVMSVEDKGIGMTKNVQSKIFERFYRQSAGNVHDVKGFGLGLNYVRAIVDAHKGTITVTSEPGKGSRFDIFLPINGEN